MARKRKASKGFDQPQPTKHSKFGIEEKFDDSEDEFYAGRDEILLDESADTKRRRRIVEQEKDLQPSDDEPFAAQDEGDDDSDGSNESIVSSSRSGGEDGAVRSRKRTEEANAAEESDDEHWGTSRADYYDADVIETEADALEEEKEAKKLHQKQMKGMTEADFGFDEDDWISEQTSTARSKILTEKLPEAHIPQGATSQQKLQILQNRYPELQPLAYDFLRLQSPMRDLDLQAEQTMKQISEGRRLAAGLPITIKRDALAAYLSSISAYFAVISITSGTTNSQNITAMPPLELHEHPVIESVSRARQLWDRVVDEEVAGLEKVPIEPSHGAPQIRVNGGTGNSSSTNNIGSRATTGLRPDPTSSKHLPVRTSNEYATKSETLATQTLVDKKSKKSKRRGDVADVDLDTLLREAVAENVNSEDDFGDEQPLTEEQYAEKDRKRKSLRFYTSQIASKANRRGHASREAGGDDDLPHKERQRDRQERLMKAAEARGKGELDNFDDAADDIYDEVPNYRRQDENDEYYKTLLNAADKKKTDKRAKAEAYAAAAQAGAEVYEEETVGPDGKRAITYAIAKNKGLAPKRKKEVRNPRVKKRKKFDEKMKKLGSMKQVYKGGEGRGGYGGELTGIKTNIVKSMKL